MKPRNFFWKCESENDGRKGMSKIYRAAGVVTIPPIVASYLLLKGPKN